MERENPDRQQAQPTREELLAEVNALRQQVARLETATAQALSQQHPHPLPPPTNTILESISDGFVSLDRQWRYTYVNSQAEYLLGKPKAELLGNNAWDIFPELVGTRGHTLIQQAMAEQKAIAYEEFYLTFNKWISVRLYPSPQGMSIYFLDITEQKQAEEQIQRYADIVKSTQLGLAVWQLQDLDNPDSLQLLLANPASNQILGTDFEALVGSTIAESFPSLAGSNLVREYAEVIKTGQTKDIDEVHYDDERISGVFSIKAFPLPNHCVGVAFESITQRRQMEKALQAAMQRLVFHVENTPLGVVEWDCQYRVSRWSSQAEAIFGWTAEEVLGKRPDDWNFVYPADRPQVHQAIAQLLCGQNQRNRLETRNFTKSGAVIHCEWYTSALFNEQGNFESALCLVLDVTERKQADANLQAANQRTLDILESMTEGFSAFDDQWRYTYLNLRGETILGVKRDEIIGRSIWDVFPDTVSLSFYNEFNRAMHDQVAVHLEEHYRPLNIWLDCHAYPLDGGGICVYFQDITSRKRMENTLQTSRERLELVLGASELGIWFCDLPFDHLEWSNTCKEHFGLPLDLEVTIEQFYQCLHPDDRETTQQAIEQSILNHNSFDTIYRVITPDQQVRWIRAIGSAFYDEKGKPIRFDGVTVDVTRQQQQDEERLRLYKAERVARELAESANRVKDEFLAVLSHELRSPLNPILGWSRLLRSRQLDKATTDRALETIERNAKLQTQLIEDLLDISRILQGKLSLSIGPVHLIPVIESAIETVRLAAEAKSIQIQTVFDPQVGRVAGDPTRLQQIVWNLVSNAVKFTSAGDSVTVRLDIQPDEKCPTADLAAAPHPGYAQITVTDTGKGIHRDFLPYVFDYFRQADSTITRRFGGLGLGLAIVRYLVELHGGTVQADSPGEGLGATFTVKLPLLNQTSYSLEETPSTAQVAAVQPLRGTCVLVVDDEPDMREFATFVLQQAGATVMTATSAHDALQLLVNHTPDLLLSDIGMPMMDGYTLMRQIRKLPIAQGGNIPAIALTAYAGEYNQRQALSAGFQQHLPKPIEPDTLIMAIAQLIRTT
ncbi:PAS domain-containing protein [Oculatella sp. LEGE 06141]|nr:PAS domain-containing protein [Oculatella sp. LEGE 06141]